MNNVVSLNRERNIFDEKYLRAKDLSKIFIGLSPSTFDGWARKGLLSSYKIEGSKFYKLSEVQALIENSKEVV